MGRKKQEQQEVKAEVRAVRRTVAINISELKAIMAHEQEEMNATLQNETPSAVAG